MSVCKFITFLAIIICVYIVGSNLLVAFWNSEVFTNINEDTNVKLNGLKRVFIPIDDHNHTLQVITNAGNVDDDGRCIMFLHGFPETSEVFTKMMKKYQYYNHKEIRVIAPDLRGYNRSYKPENIEKYDWEHLENDVVKIMYHFKVSQCVFFGHDFGGLLTWKIIEDNPKIVKSAVIANAPHPSAYSKLMKTQDAKIRIAQISKSVSYTHLRAHET